MRFVKVLMRAAVLLGCGLTAGCGGELPASDVPDTEQAEILGSTGQAACSASDAWYKSQYDGSTYQNLNCGTASSAMMRYALTCGASNVSGAYIRARTYDSSGAKDTAGGTNLHQAATVLNYDPNNTNTWYDGTPQYWAQKHINDGYTVDQLATDIGNGYVAQVAGNCKGCTYNSSTGSCSKPYSTSQSGPCGWCSDGGHALFVAAWNGSTFTVYDPDAHMNGGTFVRCGSSKPGYFKAQWTKTQLKNWMFDGMAVVMSKSGNTTSTPPPPPPPPPGRKAQLVDFYDYGDGTTDLDLFASSDGTTFTYEGAWEQPAGYWPTSKVGSRAVSGDFNGDGRADVATLYDYGSGEVRIHTFLSDGSGFNTQSYSGWWTSGGGYWPSFVDGRFVAGDFDGDGKSDLAALYDYGSGASRIHVWKSTGSSFVMSSTTTNKYDGWWATAAGYWPTDHVADRIVSGDFNGDGKWDIATLYDYGSGATRIHVFRSTGTSFVNDNGYAGWWATEAGYWPTSKVGNRVVAGDFNADGRADIATLYNYENGAARIHMFRSTGTSFVNDNGYSGWWATTSGFDPTQVAGRFVAGDLNADGRSDLAVLYDNGNGGIGIRSWHSTGTAMSYKGQVWSSANWPNWAPRVGDRFMAGFFK